MQQTLQLLQSINEGDFETLVAFFLRRRDPQLAGLIHTGVNEDGKPIPCPVDSIFYAPGDPPHCFAVATTTTSYKGLVRKWLGGKDCRGDIEKAVEEFRRWKKAQPNTVCTLYLATNRMLKGNVDLYRRVIGEGHDNAIDVRVIEASQLLDFLCVESAGQYLRQELLGIEADRLSDDLLRAVAMRSLSHHRKWFAGSSFTRDREIPRSVLPVVLDALNKEHVRLLGLRGPSGTGKSTLLRQVGEVMNSSGVIALWLPAEDISGQTSLAAVLTRALRRFQPSLNEHAGDDALRLAASLPEGLVLLVDDLNRCPAPQDVLHAVRVFATGEDDAGSIAGQPSLELVRFVLTLWPANSPLSPTDSGQEERSWRFIDVGAYDVSERVELVSSYPQTEQNDITQILEVLDGDPFLCGLASTRFRDLHLRSRSQLIVAVIENVLREVCQDAVQLLRGSATQSDIMDALDSLIVFMLETDLPEPSWRQVRQALGEVRSSLLLALAHTNRVAWLEQEEFSEKWRWKHQRWRDALLGRWLALSWVKTKGRDVSELPASWLLNPGLAEAWALALLYLSSRDRAQAIQTLTENHPLALAEMVRLNVLAGDRDSEDRALSGLKSSLEGFVTTKAYVAEPRWHILEKLATARSNRLLEVLDRLPGTPYVWSARLYNGDWSAGWEWISCELEREFPPSMGYHDLELAVATCARLYENTQAEAVRTLETAIMQPGTAQATAILAGYVAWPALAPIVGAGWRRLPEEEYVTNLTPFVWALSRCATKPTASLLQEMLINVRVLSDEERIQGKVHQGNDRYWEFMEPIRLSQRWVFTATAMETWARVANELQDLRESLCYLLRYFDHPAALDVYVHWSASKRGTLWDETFEAIDPVAKRSDKLRLPRNTETRDFLWNLLLSDDCEDVRRVAFGFWQRAASPTDLPRLRELPSSHVLFDRALQLRCQIGDATAAPLLVERMNSSPERWCRLGIFLYQQPNVRDTLLSSIESALHSPNGWGSESIIRHLPAADVLWLVANKRQLLSDVRRTWLPLWQTDLPAALDFVQSLITQANESDLRHFFIGDSFPFPVSRGMLDSLVPVLTRFPDSERTELAELAIGSGFEGWVEKNLPDVLRSEARFHFHLASDEATAVLNAAAGAVPNGPDALLRIPNFLRLERRSSNRLASS